MAASSASQARTAHDASAVGDSHGASGTVVIAGGTLVAPVLALALARAGYRVHILDSTPEAFTFERDVRPIAVSASTVRVLRTLGVWDTLAASGTAIKTIHVAEAGALARLRLHAPDCGVSAFGYVLQAGKIGAALRTAIDGEEQIARTVGVHRLRVECSRSVTRVEAETDTGSLTCETPLLVAADNAPERLEEAPLKVSTHAYGQVAIACAVQTSVPHGNVAYERFIEGGPLALLPLTNGRVGVVWTVAEDEAADWMNVSDDNFCAALRRRFGGYLGRFSAPGPRVSFPLALRSARVTDRDARIILLGNASLQLHPVAGQGFNLAVRDVADLADVLIQPGQHASEPVDDAGSAAVREAFERARGTDRARVRYGTDLAVRLYSSSNPLARIARAPILGLLSAVPGAAPEFAQLAMGLGLPQSRLVRELST